MIRTVKGIKNYPVSLSSIRQYLKHEDDENTAEIDEIESMLAACVTYIEKKTGLVLSPKTVRETFEHSGDNLYDLSLRPFALMKEIKCVYSGNEAALSLTDNSHVSGDYEKTVTAIIASDCRLTVEYEVGYGHANTEICPADIILAVKNQVFHWYENRDLYKEMEFSNQVYNIIRSYNNFF